MKSTQINSLLIGITLGVMAGLVYTDYQPTSTFETQSAQVDSLNSISNDTVSEEEKVDETIQEEVDGEQQLQAEIEAAEIEGEREEREWLATNPEAAAGRYQEFGPDCEPGDMMCMQDACDDVTDIPVNECEALVEFYLTTNGDNRRRKSNWLLNNAACSWIGISCKNGGVTLISLNNNNISGPLPNSLGNLASLEKMLLTRNTLNGNIPSSFTNLSSLENLSLDDNRLEGSIPAELGNIVSLESISLRKNRLDGPIPESFGSRNTINRLSLDNNQLCGNVPESFKQTRPAGVPRFHAFSNNRLQTNKGYSQSMLNWLNSTGFPFGVQKPKICPKEKEEYFPNDS